MGWKVLRRLDELQKITKFIFMISVVFSIIFFGIALSITVNVYLHELGHYVVADYYNLNPEMHVNNVLNVEDNAIRVNMNPVAYVQYQHPGDSRQDIMKNIYITLAGPLVNLFLGIFFVILYLIIRFTFIKRMNKRIGGKSSYTQLRIKNRMFNLIMLLDVLFVSLIVPSFLSFFVNISNFPGSDGAFLRELLTQL